MLTRRRSAVRSKSLGNPVPYWIPLLERIVAGKSAPKYRFHKARNCAVVTIRGRDLYLGEYDSPESREKYHRLIAEHLAARREPLPPVPADAPLTVTELVARYWRFVNSYYVKEGRPTKEVSDCLGVPAAALRPHAGPRILAEEVEGRPRGDDYARDHPRHAAYAP